MTDWFQLAYEKEQDMIETRRYLHQYPELSFQEKHTHDYIVERLQKLNFQIDAHVGQNGILARILGEEPGPTIALRADFDALPIDDLKDVPYRSKVPGVMHACGHDGHTSILLTVAELLHEHQSELKGTVVLIFQYGEELTPGGAQEMIADNALMGVDKIYGNHLWTGYPTGTIHTRPGPMMAQPDEFHITLFGKGGHGAKPHETIDPIVILAEFILSAQKIVSRTIDPVKQAVLSFGKIEAGNADSVIPDTATCQGTVRTFDSEVQTHIYHKMDKLLQGLALANDITYSFDYIKGYLPVYNHEASAETVKKAANALNFRYHDSDLMMVGEDFSFYLKARPGAFFFTGCGNPQKETDWPHHSPHFDIDESAMKYAVSTFMKILELEGNF
ncbi:N-acetyl-L,L-diaminopimelate deacetylase [Staphylococcus schleiferi]|uniref:M20 family metallopeptidase n=1 Tax=Staphylococcus coagulans TaxID=74706 RepID=UPI00067A1F17|nr:M20 family metallopeptidase [Staphylococcus coagulans]AKS70022.1 N-acetyl-L,L-diaminopimelate deacetylase [Staphylococcus schleiferi]AKS72141.1 N-acetyl-L,L-diaminopimelate deacetylase [Staphylococcus schleiferi]AKS74428.1 N-acetyl-L,L-diaminopimelate deacetylase [Staphylococcus schleiferi]MBA8760897.1 amidohydrolase [Staphylococcus coagulans]MBA8764132.1 amidohydrolase [Staphylococcus coagulans]